MIAREMQKKFIMAEISDYIRLTKHVVLRGAIVGSTFGIFSVTGSPGLVVSWEQAQGQP